jgi:uncharacterized protein (DUF924 family)
MNKDIDNIIGYWFGIDDGDVIDVVDVVEDRDGFWFAADSKVDQQIQHRFSDLVIEAGKGNLDAWAETARGSFANFVARSIYT